MNDWELLQEFRSQRSESAFGALVKRYVDFVYSSALRQVRQPQLAEEVTQAVFILLARKAASFRPGIVLPGWFFRTTRFTASRAMRTEIRRQQREQEAFHMQELTAPDETWRVIAPVLEEALDDLSEADRDAVLVRFIDDKNFRDTGAALGISEDAAKKRVSRALDKLRVFFQRRGFTISAVTLGAALSQQFVTAAPANLAASITAASVRAGLSPQPLPFLKIAAGFVGLGLATFLVLQSTGSGGVKPRRAAESIPARPTESRSTPAAVRERVPTGLKLHVVDAETGRGISGAKVLTTYWQGLSVQRGADLLTDANGFCELPIPGDLGRLDLGVLVDWYVQKYLVFRDKTVWPVPSTYTLKLERAVSAGGWVRNEAGQPVPDAGIVFEFPYRGDHSEREPRFERLGFIEDVALTKTDADGRWACAVLPRDYKDFTIRVSHPAYLGSSYSADSSDVPMTNLWGRQCGVDP